MSQHLQKFWFVARFISKGGLAMTGASEILALPKLALFNRFLGEYIYIVDLYYTYRMWSILNYNGCKFGHQMVPFVLVANLATKLRHLYWLQI